ncbi:MAG TPA: isochorismatase family cysteine hydrolase [Candidatus Acidoferrales bacterium]|nr:isochorismatase family cysteine hydrolase [Candidatus Acidoferrales bacterium]
MSRANKSDLVFWEVDAQADFMLPGGKLYVPGAEKRVANMQRLVAVARAGKVFLISSADQHASNDPEFVRFPPHCVKGTKGAEILPELKASKILPIPNDNNFSIPVKLGDVQQIVLEKQTLDVFDNPNTEKILKQFPATEEFIVFGVVTEFCVRLAAKGLLERGRRVAIVTDAIETLNANEGQRTLDELSAAGVRLITTDEALALIK